MQGSRHEKAALVLASYVIGFTTAFILYAQITSNTETTFISVPQAMPAAAIEAVATEEVKEVAVEGFVSYKDGRLTVTKGDTTTLLSFNPEKSDLRADTAAMSQGFHYSTPVYAVSGAEDYVFFCENQDVTTETCVGFVYSVETDTIHQVTKNGAPVLVSEASARGAAWSAAGLTIGSNSSADVATPWELGN